jgi:hypothetical protein
MSKAKQSYEEHKDAILASLPEALRAEAEANLTSGVEDVPVLTPEETVAAVKRELAANPNCNEQDAAEALANIKAPEPAPAPSAEDLEAQQAEALKAAKAMGPHTEPE